MRARGANMTDIAVLVVAADDGIMPQTIESINHAKAANVKLIVAINKMDKPTANPERVKEQLTKYEIVPEDWGGDVACIPVSAVTGMGISDLLERIALEAEVMELKANPSRRGKGAVVEARLAQGPGPHRNSAGPERHPAQGRLPDRRYRCGPCPHDAQRQGPGDHRGRPVHAC